MDCRVPNLALKTALKKVMIDGVTDTLMVLLNMTNLFFVGLREGSDTGPEP
jgi:hypothetical protein